MYVKSLTLRGFKSFASATTLRFEPGITCVVGPNGSGKSNIVDAMTWVMGEQGAKTLRGGKMDDVVFAGTSSRPPLGRAEVTLTIDNTDGALPIEYSEVTISRLLFRSGGSEYAINGNQCRLLDVQELLSDTGLGREMHVIVGQGQLDQILHAGPEARRALIEEAAGVLKHRRRKEKALRKLEAMQANLTRLEDLTGELRRRLKPLGRQAAIARKAAVIQADLRDARLRLLADDYVTAAAELERGETDEAAALARRAELELALTGARAKESALDADEQQHAPRLARAQETWFELSALAERLRGVASLAAERHRHLVAGDGEPRPGRDPDELEAEAEQLREQEAILGERLETAREQLTAAVAGRAAAESALAAVERDLAERARAAAARAEQLARLRGQVAAARSRALAAEEEAGRLTDACQQAQARASQAEAEYESFREVSAGRDDDRAELAAAHEEATAALAEISARVTELRAAERQASGERAALLARREALEEGIRGLQSGTDEAAVLADPGRFRGVLGAVADLLTVSEGAQDAITAALGGAADAVAVAGLDAAVDILQALKDSGSGSAGLLIAATGAAGGAAGGGAAAGPAAAGSPLPADLPRGAIAALDLVQAPPELLGAVARMLAGVVVAADLAQARDLIRQHPELRVVTRDGDLLGAHWAQGGAARPPSTLAMRTAAEEAAAQLAGAERAGQEAAQALAAVAAEEEQARRAVADALARLQEVDAAAAKTSGQLGRLSGAARAARDEAARLEAAITSARRQQEHEAGQLAELTARLGVAEAGAGDRGRGADGSGSAGGPQQAGAAGDDAAGDSASGDGASGGEAGPDLAEQARDELAEAVASARNAETEARLEVRTAEERLRAIAGRADQLAAQAVAERRAAEQASERRAERARQAVVARAVADGAGLALARLAESVTVAAAERQAAEESSKGRATSLKAVRAQVRELTAELDRVVDSAHGAEIARAERRMRLEQLAGRGADEFGVDADALVREYGPDVLIPPVTPEAAAAPPVPVTEDGDPVPGNGHPALLVPAQSNGHGPHGGQGGADGWDDGEPAGVPYVRAEQEKRAAAAQRQLDQLGKVNPLALEEFAALEERHAFLATQLEDLRKTRRDLLTVVKEVDDRVQEVFTSAFEDTAREFERIIGRLFPGGDGRLVLTEPDDMLATGIDVEARPPGKKVKRLSLLSGGERSLTAIAYLVAIFKARPSPFYVLDEVEAALDDTNLQRLLHIFEELRDTSQLIVITHQKRTMEVADALYGITMAGDGVSSVVSQRLREPERA
ncbi:MAG: chromosome segregation protein SMC [Gemmatimonadota bacterium]